MDFSVTTDVQEPGVVVFRLAGQFDFSHVATARAAINPQIDQGAEFIVANLDGLNYIDSAGLGVLVGTLARLKDRGGELAVVCHAPRIRRVFDITRLTQLIPLHNTEEEAFSHRVPAMP
jgi:anti-sigma B factor antagonist